MVIKYNKLHMIKKSKKLNFKLKINRIYLKNYIFTKKKYILQQLECIRSICTKPY